MRYSQLFTKTRKEAPKDEASKNAQLLIRAGFVVKEMAGAYVYLPLGLRVLKKIEQIIRDEMNAIGGQEILMTSLQNPEVWEASGRWDDTVVDNWFKSELAVGGEVGIANTHEEPLANLLKQHVSSYKDLPVYAYQFQTKFRNELRAKSGLMRGREFVMKDLYSFNASEKDFKEFYETAAQAYLNIFNKVGLGKMTYRTFASGGSFSKFSDEFQTVSDAGEDIIYIDEAKNIAVNKEVYNDEVITELGLDKTKLKQVKAIEVGNIFPLGTKYAEAEGLSYRDEAGTKQYPVMGSYGIGLGRLMGTITEVYADNRGIVWPESVAPFTAHLISLGENKTADAVYKELTDAGIDVLYDDREDASAGEKFADADLIGIPYRLVVSAKTKDKIEFKRRTESKTELVSLDQVVKIITDHVQ
jgi:prolyl-tRNA synthetase